MRIKANVISDGNDSRVISWEPVNTSAYAEVLFSFNPESGFSVLSPNCTDTQYTDNRIIRNTNRTAYYKIKVYDALGVMIADSGIVHLESNYDGVLGTIIYNETTLNRLFQGNPYWIVKSAKSGARCPVCWDHFRDEAKFSNCPECHSTGYVLGTYEKISAFISVSSDPKKSGAIPEGEMVTDTLQGRLSNYPLVDTNDYAIEEMTGKRFLITSVEVTKLPVISRDNSGSTSNHVASQIITMVELERDHEFYKIHEFITSPEEVM